MTIQERTSDDKVQSELPEVLNDILDQPIPQTFNTSTSELRTAIIEARANGDSYATGKLPRTTHEPLPDSLLRDAHEEEKKLAGEPKPIIDSNDIFKDAIGIDEEAEQTSETTPQHTYEKNTLKEHATQTVRTVLEKVNRIFETRVSVDKSGNLVSEDDLRAEEQAIAIDSKVA